MYWGVRRGGPRWLRPVVVGSERRVRRGHNGRHEHYFCAYEASHRHDRGPRYGDPCNNVAEVGTPRDSSRRRRRRSRSAEMQHVAPTVFLRADATRQNGGQRRKTTSLRHECCTGWHEQKAAIPSACYARPSRSAACAEESGRPHAANAGRHSTCAGDSGECRASGPRRCACCTRVPFRSSAGAPEDVSEIVKPATRINSRLHPPNSEGGGANQCTAWRRCHHGTTPCSQAGGGT